jgi:hypothetical protein
MSYRCISLDFTSVSCPKGQVIMFKHSGEYYCILFKNIYLNSAYVTISCEYIDYLVDYYSSAKTSAYNENNRIMYTAIYSNTYESMFPEKSGSTLLLLDKYAKDYLETLTAVTGTNEFDIYTLFDNSKNFDFGTNAFIHAEYTAAPDTGAYAISYTTKYRVSGYATLLADSTTTGETTYSWSLHNSSTDYGIYAWGKIGTADWVCYGTAAIGGSCTGPDGSSLSKSAYVSQGYMHWSYIA